MQLPSHKESLRVLEEAKKRWKESDTVKELCEEYGEDVDILDLFPMAFADLDVSARTDKGCIYFNWDLFDDFIDKNLHYGPHEIRHVFQQCWSDGPTEGSNDENYLDNEHEKEGFKTQTEYISETEGDEKAEEYIDKVMDHHDVKGKEREKRKKDLLNLASKLEA
jgi:hypothetical protein